jgi:parallel beta-helix repeat protein
MTHHFTTLRRSGVALGVLAIALPGGVTAHAQDTISCGDTITVSTTLTQDLFCGPGDGLVIGADDVVLDLGGHTITGPGAYGVGAEAGVRVARKSGVTVTKGSITGYAEAVVLDQSTDAVVSKLEAFANDRGINVGGGGGHLIEKNHLHDNGRDAVRLAVTSDNIVAKNTVTDNVFGIGVADFSDDNLVEKNVATGNRDFGVAAYSGATGTVISKNVVSATSVDGIQVTSDAVDTVVDRNEAFDNGDDGIDVDNATTTVSRNTATGNGDLGIEAVAGVIDDGGNEAAGNGNPLQCTGVVCSPVE